MRRGLRPKGAAWRALRALRRAPRLLGERLFPSDLCAVQGVDDAIEQLSADADERVPRPHADVVELIGGDAGAFGQDRLQIARAGAVALPDVHEDLGAPLGRPGWGARLRRGGWLGGGAFGALRGFDRGRAREGVPRR